MNTEIIKIQPGDGPVSEEDDAKLKAAGEILRRGGLVAFPTETVYGLGGDALNPTSSKRIYAAKGRPSDNPLIVHIYRFEDIYKITGDVSEEARRIADAFWPGPLTMILPKSDAVPYETTGGLDTVAIRMPSHPADQIQRGIYCGTQCQYFRETESYRGQICRGRYDGPDRCHYRRWRSGNRTGVHDH